MTNLQRQLETLAREYNLVALYAFGSRAREIAARVRGEPATGEHPASDIDIGVQLPRGAHLDITGKVDLCLALEGAFAVPRVDLVVCGEAPPSLAQEIVSGELLFATNLDEQAEYELYVFRRAADLAPFERERRRLILEEGAR
jgi:predicted nucleotidyltransferase